MAAAFFRETRGTAEFDHFFEVMESSGKTGSPRREAENTTNKSTSDSINQPQGLSLNNKQRAQARQVVSNESEKAKRKNRVGSSKKGLL